MILNSNTKPVSNRKRVEEIELNILIPHNSQKCSVLGREANCFSDHFTNLPLWCEQTLIHCPFLGIH